MHQPLRLKTVLIDYTTGNLVDYDNFSKHYRLIAIDLSKQFELVNPDVI